MVDLRLPVEGVLCTKTLRMDHLELKHDTYTFYLMNGLTIRAGMQEEDKVSFRNVRGGLVGEGSVRRAMGGRGKK